MLEMRWVKHLGKTFASFTCIQLLSDAKLNWLYLLSIKVNGRKEGK